MAKNNLNKKIEKFKKQWRGKKVVIMGLGLNGGGLGAARFFAQLGAKIIATDLKTKNTLAPILDQLKKFKNIKFVLGKHRDDDFKNSDLIVKNPAIPNSSYFLKIAQQHNIPIQNDVGIFFTLINPKNIIGITGTRGKSTAAKLAYLFLKSKYPTLLGGLKNQSVLNLIDKIKKGSKIILELSSFGLEGLKSVKISPSTALITNLFYDHLNRYKNLKEYIAAKQNIYKFQQSGDYFISNADDPNTKKYLKTAPAKHICFGFTNAKQTKHYIKNSWLYYNKKPLMPLSSIKLPGFHQLTAVLAAIAVASLYKISSKHIKKTLQKFPGLSGHIEKIATKNGVVFLNDTASTMPDATIAAINYLKQIKAGNIILVAGGANKNLKYKTLAKTIKEKVNEMILLKGNASELLKKELKKINYDNYINANTVKKAVRVAASWAKKKDYVLLSPGAASFSMYNNEFERGEDFNRTVKALKL